MQTTYMDSKGVDPSVCPDYRVTCPQGGGTQFDIIEDKTGCP